MTELDITTYDAWGGLLAENLRGIGQGLAWRERFERVLAACEDHLYTWAEPARPLALTLCRTFE